MMNPIRDWRAYDIQGKHPYVIDPSIADSPFRLGLMLKSVHITLKTVHNYQNLLRMLGYFQHKWAMQIRHQEWLVNMTEGHGEP
jgi:hypothetical protein